MANVVPGVTFTSTTAITAANLNLAAQPTVTIGSAEVTNAMLASASGLGYSGTGTGGTVTQATNKATGVTLDKANGAITMNNASLNDATNVSFTVTNSVVAANDAVIVNHASAGTAGAYQVSANAIAAGSFAITVRNVSGGALGEAIVLKFAVLKGTAA